jgi:hypothetical protein
VTSLGDIGCRAFSVGRLVYSFGRGHHASLPSCPNEVSDMRHLPSNKSLQATRDGVSSSAIADYVIRPACLSSGR